MSPGEKTKPNRLRDETSPYLLQHAFNPVEWYPWGPEALEKARRERKPILLSIGYSACHWCHVMEHESFEDESTARLMNENFVNIKVDREERPDLDEIYMKAVQMMTGHGGWPMTVFLTPELKPFFGGTYFPPEDRLGMPGFKRVLNGVSSAWSEQQAKVEESSEELTKYLTALGQIERADTRLDYALIEGAITSIIGTFDRLYGGFGGAPKFPQTYALHLAMRCSQSENLKGSIRQECLDLVSTTLDRMAYGGIHDHLGGGFARYSVDRQWLVPHFEKMLYDNAALTRAYLDGYLIHGRKFYLAVASGCLDFVLRELTASDGAFYSSLDADSQGEEGKFYVWRPETVRGVLGEDDGRFFCEAFDISTKGNFEHGFSVPHLIDSPENLSRRFNLTADEFAAKINALKAKLLAEREGRERPERDEKVLTSWNGMMISSFVAGYKVLGEERYLKAACRAAQFIIDHLYKDGRLLRTFARGQAKLNGYLDDYAHFAESLIALAGADFNPKWLEVALALVDTTLAHFWDGQEGTFFYTSDDHEALVSRPKNFFDGSTASGTSVMTMNLLRLWQISGRDIYRQRAESVLTLYAPHFGKAPDQFANLLCALDFYLKAHSLEVLLLAKPMADGKTEKLLQALNRCYLPNAVLLLSDPDRPPSMPLALLQGRHMIEGQPTVYLCRNYACATPITEPPELERALENMKS